MKTYPTYLFIVWLSISACDDPGSPSTPGGPSTGTLVVSTSTEGDDADQDGYLLRVDDAASFDLDPTGSAEVELAPGRHVLNLLGVSGGCLVTPGITLEVEVPSQDTTAVAFEVTCSVTGIRIRTTTTGLGLDTDGYRLEVDGIRRESLPSNGTTLVRVDPGSRTIALAGLTPNCMVDGPNARTLTVVATEVALIEFAVVCTATPESPTLAFESNGDIYVTHLDGSSLRRLTSDGSPNSYNREAAWSPDGSRIAFSKSDGRWGSGIYVMEADGANPTRLSPEGAYDASPTWSPDGSRIAFENRADNQSIGHIFVMSADGTNRMQLTSNRQPNSYPAWSPDGQRIAYVTYADRAGDDGTDIYLINADGTNRVRLTTDPEFDWVPEWSPDGRRIVFSRYPDLLVMDADGTNLERLTHGGGAAWSPDGSMIAFSRSTLLYVDAWGDPHTRVRMWVLRLADGATTELPLQVGRPGGPSWRP